MPCQMFCNPQAFFLFFFFFYFFVALNDSSKNSSKNEDGSSAKKLVGRFAFGLSVTLCIFISQAF